MNRHVLVLLLYSCFWAADARIVSTEPPADVMLSTGELLSTDRHLADDSGADVTDGAAPADAEHMTSPSGTGHVSLTSLEVTDQTDITTDVTSKAVDDTLSSPELSPPHIRQPVTQERRVRKSGSGDVIQCEADGYPPPTYEWLRNDVAIDDVGDYMKAFNNGTLVLQGFTDRESGMFQCRAKNRFGTSVSVKFPILATKDPIIGDDGKVEAFNVSEGQSFHAYCAQTPHTVPDYIKRWYQHPDKTQINPDSRIGIDNNGTLRIVNVTKNDNQAYVCGLAPFDNPGATIIFLYNKVSINVLESTSDYMRPKKEYVPAVVKATLGKTVELECFFSGYPAPNITWKTNKDQDIEKGEGHYEITDFGRKLRIEQVREEDEGTYSCTASNDAGSDDARIFLNVTNSPMRLHEADYVLDRVTKPSGQMATLKCFARAMEGENLEPPVWYRNGELLTTDNLPDKTRYSFGAGGTELTIRNLKKSTDTACFQCNISNSEGYIFYDGFLKVVESIKITRPVPPEIDVTNADDSLDISVLSSQDPCCDVTRQWSISGHHVKNFTRRDLQSAPFFGYDKNGRLFFNKSSVTEDDLKNFLGEYMCRVSNKYQTVEVKFRLTKTSVAEGVRTAEVTEGGLALWVIMLICGLLTILVAVVIITAIVKSNFPRDTYPLEKNELSHDLDPATELLNKSFQEL
ncbi:hemicentin-1-like isoform X2 [Physella acuta]|uniref:hemicentin-1-like isoform X2 n=1 Tax=Physella acuta TaxID=109671 RepID=UPI0027DB0357|nr:hemicentin-1-like isoform X2 [Physella acuta]